MLEKELKGECSFTTPENDKKFVSLSIRDHSQCQSFALSPITAFKLQWQIE